MKLINSRKLPGNTLSLIARSLKKQWKRYRNELQRCQKDFSEKSVHKSRITARRLLSTLELLSPFLPAQRIKKARQRLKRHLDSFDDLRDTQIQMAAVTELLRAFPKARGFDLWLREREERFAGRTRYRLKRISTKPLAKLVSACQKDLKKQRQECPPKVAATRLERSVGGAFARTLTLRKRIDRRQTNSIHCTRVAFKRFRYMVEVLAAHLPAADEKLLAEMQHYQTMMGDIQDTEVLLRALDKYLRKKKSDFPRGFREELVRRSQWLIRVYLDAADQLHEFWPLPWVTRA